MSFAGKPKGALQRDKEQWESLGKAGERSRFEGECVWANLVGKIYS